jgi:DNA polymerase III alpha subunit
VIRTGYSFRTAVGHLPEVISRIKEIGWAHAPICDRYSTFGWAKWAKLCKVNDLHPVFGVEIAVTPSLGEKKPILDYWTFVAKDDIRAIHELIRVAGLNAGREPSLTYAQALEAEGVFKVTGPAVLLDRVPPEMPDLFFGLSPAAPRGLVRRAMSEGHRPLALSNNFYPRAEDLELYRVILGARSASTQTYPMHVMSDDELRRALAGFSDWWVEEGLENRDLVLAASTAGLKRAELLHFPVEKTLREQCEAGALKLGIDLSDPTYRERVERELRLIDEKNFADYFYIIADLMQYARRHMVVGPARGSSCGSLVCYLLGITSIDPIPYGLIFERFIDTTRTDLPDIDLDFSDAKRHLVFEYLDRKYGFDRSARLGSVNMLKAKAALNLVGVSLRIPKNRIEELSKTVIKRSMGDSRAGSTIADTFASTEVGQSLMRDFPEAEITGRMEGHPGNAAQHAAGVVLTEDAVLNYVAVDPRTGATMCDKRDAEDINLLKIDALGLTQLSIFERCMELAGIKPDNEFLEGIPLDDQAAFDVLNDRRFSGIFQFTPGTASARLVEEMVINQGGKMNDLEDIVSFTAIVRPGPLGSGQAEEWIKRRCDRSPVSYPHESFEPYLKKTLGIIIYQEQVITISRDIGGLDWDDTTQLRKAMSKSMGKEFFNRYGEKWKRHAVEAKGIPQKMADTLWDDLCTFGMWAFNRSHSVAYGVVSYWCCWLKAHFPLEFAAATLDAQTSDADLQIATLRELVTEGYSYVPVDAERSTDRWTVHDGVLLGPLTNIKGIGPKAVMEIVAARQTGKELKPGIRKKLEEAKTAIDSLTPITDAIAGCDLGAKNIISTPLAIGEIDGGEYNVVVMGKIVKVAPLNENEPARVAKRNGRVFTGPVESVNIFIRDDTGEIFAKVGRYDFDRIGRPIIEKCRPGKSLYALKGDVPSDFRMIRIRDVRYIGEMDD